MMNESKNKGQNVPEEILSRKDKIDNLEYVQSVREHYEEERGRQPAALGEKNVSSEESRGNKPRNFPTVTSGYGRVTPKKVPSSDRPAEASPSRLAEPDLKKPVTSKPPAPNIPAKEPTGHQLKTPEQLRKQTVVAPARSAGGKNGGGMRKKRVIIGVVGALVVVSLIAFFAVNRMVLHKNIELFKAAVAQKDLVTARRSVIKIQKNYDTKRELRALDLFEAEQSAYLAEVGEDAALLERSGGEEWMQVAQLVEKATAVGDPATGAEQFKEARLGVARIRKQTAGRVQVETDFYNAWERTAEPLEKYIPSQYHWFAFEQKKARAVEDPAERGQLYTKLLVKLEETTERVRLFQEKEAPMLRAKQRWLAAVGRLPSATVLQFESQHPSEWATIQQGVRQAEADEAAARFMEAQSGYEAAIVELNAIHRATYVQALETVEKAERAMELDRAYAALDQADKSGYSDLSEAKTARLRLDQLFLPMHEAKVAYEKVLAHIDRDLLKKYGEPEWSAIQKRVEQGETTSDPIQATQCFNQASSELSELLYPLYLRGAKKAIDSKQWNEARSFVQKASAIQKTQELAVLQGQLPVLALRKVWVADLGNGVSMDFVPVLAGSFVMGNKSGQSQHSVTLTRPFWMGKTEVTQAQYRQVMGTVPSLFTGDQHPVEKVSWQDAVDFCKKLTAYDRRISRLPAGYEYTLPTEAQWEYACRAGTTNDFAGKLDAMGWYSVNAEGKAHPVATKLPNAWGLYDMHGNVFEWCHDWYRDSADGHAIDPEGVFSGTTRVCRGGSWNRYALYCSSAYRGRADPSKSRGNLGFRITVQKK